MKVKFRFFKDYGWLLGLSTLLLIALLTMSQILQNASQFAQSYATLLLSTFGGVILLIGFFFRTLYKLYRQYRLRVPGARITARLTLTLTLIIGIPLAIIYYFSMTFIHQGIDQWFDVKTEVALQRALQLVETTLDDRTRQKLKQTQNALTHVRLTLLNDPVIGLNQLRVQLDASELTLYDSSGQILAYSTQGNALLLPKIDPTTLQQLRQKAPIATIEQDSKTQQSSILVLTPLYDLQKKQKLTLQAKFTLNEQLTQLAESVRIASGQYQEISFLKEPLKTSFSVILSMVFLLALISAILFTLQAIRNMVRPIRTLARGTKSVAEGDYSLTMPMENDDEFGQLITSFNDMIQQIARARNEIKFGHQQTEIQKLYSQAIIKNLNSGVLTLDPNLSLKTINDATNQILCTDLFKHLGKSLQDLFKQKNMQHLQGFFAEVLPIFEQQEGQWHQQINFDSPDGQKILMVHGSTLPSLDQKSGGFVIIIEDITQLVKAQLHAAWNDVAQRLAHEIKNPLTPIQLSAERLQFKLSTKLNADDQNLLSRMTQTIIEQVHNMQHMVTAFTEYADTPEIELSSVKLNRLIQDLSNMYISPDQAWQISLELDPTIEAIQADHGQLRQLLHNLIKNALEACQEAEVPTHLRIRTEKLDKHVRLTLCDNGPGIPESDKNWIFEPYATDKPKGTGLGLAIVKKIVDEHQGKITVESSPEQGTCFIITLPDWT